VFCSIKTKSQTNVPKDILNPKICFESLVSKKNNILY